jgi:magnesium-transporting ATPase (P-type)
LIRFLLQFHHPLIYVLMAATAVTASLGEWVDAGVIFGVVLVNAVVGFIQESRAEAALDALASMMKTEARVRRDGRTVRIPSEDIVPGDVVLLESGDKVPADLRLTRIRELRVDESALTGESLPVEKADHVLPPETVVGDRKNMAFSGTFVTYGQATGVVVSTGTETELGRIHQLMGETTPARDPAHEEAGVVQQGSHGRNPRIGGGYLCTGLMARPIVHGDLHGGSRVGCRRDPRRIARRSHDHARDRRRSDGTAQCHHPQIAGGGNVGEHHRHLFGWSR